MITKEQLAKLIDHTLLKPDTTEDSIKQLCKEAKEFKFYSVCVNPTYISLASSILKGTEVKICSVIGFPLGASTPEVKALETEIAISNGASEIDMVINIGALKSQDYKLVKYDISEVVERARTSQKDIVVKVIIETGLLTKHEKEIACKLVKETGANFVKTSTGFNASGATVYDIELLKKCVGPNIKVKASGGIRTFLEAIKLINVGADRIGTSSGVVIMGQYSNEYKNKVIE
jgi:deoxyribose-phosphate aldolase